MEKICTMTNKRVCVGPGTLYKLLENFVNADMIRETKAEGRRRSYLITDTGKQALEAEYMRLMTLTADYRHYVGGFTDEEHQA
jgi:DNA-binding PadR family transcriptional regulator